MRYRIIQMIGSQLFYISLVVIVTALTPSLANAQAVVLSVTEEAGNKYSVGTFLGAGEVVSPKPGGRVTVLHGDHVVRVVAPKRLTIEENGLSDTLGFISSRLFEVFGNKGPTLVVRQGDTQALPPNLWHINPKVAGIYCTRPGIPPVFWRSVTSSHIGLQIKDNAIDRRITLRWMKGAETLSWPTAEGINIEGKFWIQSGPSNPRIIQLVTIAGQTEADWIYGMAAFGCDEQLYLLTQERSFDDGDR